MTKTFGIQWMTFGGNWRATPGPIYPSMKAAKAALKMLGLTGNPAYRVAVL
jgi:hypothetical protein